MKLTIEAEPSVDPPMDPTNLTGTNTEQKNTPVSVLHATLQIDLLTNVK